MEGQCATNSQQRQITEFIENDDIGVS